MKTAVQAAVRILMSSVGFAQGPSSEIGKHLGHATAGAFALHDHVGWGSGGGCVHQHVWQAEAACSAVVARSVATRRFPARLGCALVSGR